MIAPYAATAKGAADRDRSRRLNQPAAFRRVYGTARLRAKKRQTVIDAANDATAVMPQMFPIATSALRIGRRHPAQHASESGKPKQRPEHEDAHNRLKKQVRV